MITIHLKMKNSKISHTVSKSNIHLMTKKTKKGVKRYFLYVKLLSLRMLDSSNGFVVYDISAQQYDRLLAVLNATDTGIEIDI